LVKTHFKITLWARTLPRAENQIMVMISSFAATQRSKLQVIIRGHV